MEDTLKEGIKAGKIPHGVIFATNKDGSFTYKHAVGNVRLGDEKAISEDAVFQLASSTKLLTTIAVLQIVEKGLFGLDDDVASQLPELAEQPILMGFDENDTPIFEQRKNKITLRLLLTHSAGVVYDIADANLTKYQQQKSHTPNDGATMATRFTYPLVFEPGTSFMYGTGIDWAGHLVERVTGMTLEEYEKKNMWEPLGIKSITFFPQDHADLKAAIPGMTVRTPDGQLVPMNDPWINTGSTDCFGGHGGFGGMEDYLKVLRSILANDGKLLKPETVELMFQPQLSADSQKGLADFRHSPYAAMMIGVNDPEIKADWGLGGILFLQDDQGRRKKGTLNWGGMANTFWIIDREAGLAFTFGTQVLPPGDKPTGEMITVVEKGLYEKAGVKF